VFHGIGPRNDRMMLPRAEVRTIADQDSQNTRADRNSSLN
jgi:hypothetical protein